MALKESETIELKKSTAELKEAIISIGAILNKHKGGEIYFGIKNDGTAVGQDISEQTLREISQAVSHSIDPKIYPEIKREKINGKSCIKISFEGHERPYFAYGRAYMRVADEDKQLSVKELENFILRKVAMKWDSKPSGCTINDVDETTLREFVQKANQANRITLTYTSKKDVLKKLNLIKEGKVTHAAQLLFSKGEPITLQAAVFAGTDKNTFLDIKQFKGNIFQLLKIAELYLKQNIAWKAKLVERTRQEIPEIPLRAMTEALVNSFCHRDYQAPESNKVAIYKDKIEIWNPGDFPEGYKPQDFIAKELPSILRNPSLANILYLSSDIEQWGSGLKRIHQECKEHGIPLKLEVMKYGFTVQFTRPKIGTVKGTLNSTGQAIFDLLSKNPHLTIGELAKNFNIGRTSAIRHLNSLKEKGVLKRVGSDKTGHWEVVKR